MADFGAVGSAHVEMRAKMDRLKTDFAGARKTSATAGARAGKAFNAGFLRGTTALKGAIAGLLTGAAFKSFLAGADKAINKLDEIAKTADSIGITTDALQELRVAADLSGTDVNVLSVGLRRLARAASDAQRGSLAQKEAFEALGVSVTKTNGELKDIDVLLLEISDGFTRMDNATRKAAIAQELLGRGGTQMVNLLNSGSDAIENMRQQARDLGIVIEEDLVREAVRLKDELTLLRKEIDSNLTRAMVRAGPLLIDVARALAEIATWAANAWDGLRLLAGFDAREPVVRLGQIRDELAELDEQAKTVTETFQEFSRGETRDILGTVSDAALPFDTATDQRAKDEEIYQQRLDETATKLDQIQKRREALLTERAQLFEVTGQATPVIEGFARPEEDDGGFVDTSSQSDAAKEKIDERVRALQDMRQAILDANASLMAEREELGLEIEVLGKSNEVRDEAVAALENERAVREVLAFAQEQGLDLNSKEVQSLLELVEAQDQVRRGRDADARQLAQNEAAMERAKSAQEEFTNALEGTADALVQVAFEGGSLREVLLELLLTLVQMQSTQDALTGLFSGLFGGGGGQGGIAGQISQNAGLTGVTTRGGGGGGGGILGAIAQFALGAVGSYFGAIDFSGLAGGVTTAQNNQFSSELFDPQTGNVLLPQFADGGFASRGTIAMVGEEGPEIGVFGSAARIFSNEDLRRVLSAPKEQSMPFQGGTVNFNISTPDVGGFRRSQPQLAAEMQRILNSGNRQQ